MNFNAPFLRITLTLFIIVTLWGCEKQKQETNQPNCNAETPLSFNERPFLMGFSTWPFGPGIEEQKQTFQYINENADIYSEQLDEYIPWRSLINSEPFSDRFTSTINNKVSRRPKNHKLILSISLLNNGRDNLLPDLDGFLPSYNNLNDPLITNAYFKYVEYLISKFDPNYVVLAMEVNELLIHTPAQWPYYKILINNIKPTLQEKYPNITFSESITLHKLINPETEDDNLYRNEIITYANNLDLACISFYPFMNGLSEASQFQEALDIINDNITVPIAFTETAHIAEDLIITTQNVNIPTSECEQREYLATLLNNAALNNYQFIIWWTVRDFDQLWEIFPESTKDLGRIWRDTGLLNESGEERPAWKLWQQAFKLEPFIYLTHQ